MKRCINYLKSKFETGDIPTQDDFSDLIDSTFNSGSTDISIPILNITSKGYNQLPLRRRDKLMAYWSSVDLSFLNYDPEVWLYRFSRRNKKLDTPGEKLKHNKYVHTPHKNGIKYPGSNFYAGQFICNVQEIRDSGVTTEFYLYPSGNTLFEIPLDPYDWCYNGNTKLTDSNSINNVRFFGRGKTTQSFPFKMAITINDPNGGQQRIVGPMSETIYLVISHSRFLYRRSGIGWSLDRIWDTISP